MNTIPLHIRENAIELLTKIRKRAAVNAGNYRATLDRYHAREVSNLPNGPLPLMGQMAAADLDVETCDALIAALNESRPEHETRMLDAARDLPRVRRGRGAEVLFA